MTTHDFDNRIKNSIDQLSEPESYRLVCHEHLKGEPMPSNKNIQRIIELVREILFPGYFGSTTLRRGTTSHYMGVYIDELFPILTGEILAGMCFECEDQGENKMARHS
ncbi:MAG TPA: hypothetical protein PK335_08295, partial [Draconibacterium sp.]|nr:hypothetical protein [Draconibacterium sp.]